MRKVDSQQSAVQRVKGLFTLMAVGGGTLFVAGLVLLCTYHQLGLSRVAWAIATSVCLCSGASNAVAGALLWRRATRIIETIRLGHDEDY